MLDHTDDIPTWHVDLMKDEDLRWNEMQCRDIDAAINLAEQARAEAEAIYPGWLLDAVGKALQVLYGLSGGRYVKEINSWADAIGISHGEGVLLNCTYELSFACTAGIIDHPRLGLVHVRSMDWPLSEISNATRLVQFTDGGHQFVAVGIAGFVGVLSGMVPGAYSVTINWAPPTGLPRFLFGPAFLLREVLESQQTFDDAVAVLEETPLSASVFFTVCGTESGEACVIERTQKKAAVRWIGDDGVLVQANHHLAGAFKKNNAKFDEIDDSKARAKALEASLRRKRKAKTLEDVAGALDVEPVNNDESHQQMAFCPHSSKVLAWRSV